jgi:RNA polymerase sigma-70 factor (ECF subfamily)
MTKAEAYKLTDSEVVELIVSTKQSGHYEVLYDRYAQKVYNKCLSFVKDKALAEDLTHDIFLKVYLKLSTFSNKSQFGTWLYSISYNHCVDYVNKSKRIASVAEKELTSDYDDAYADEEMMRLKVDRLKTVMEELSPDDRMILLMKYQDDMSVRDIMTATDSADSAVKMRLKRARERLLQLYTSKYKNTFS